MVYHGIQVRSSRIVPIYEGHVLYDNINYVTMNGHNITQIIMKQCAMFISTALYRC